MSSPAMKRRRFKHWWRKSYEWCEKYNLHYWLGERSQSHRAKLKMWVADDMADRLPRTRINTDEELRKERERKGSQQ